MENDTPGSPAGAIGAQLVGPLTAVLGAAAYLAGYLQIAFFASALGVTAGDLGLSTRDYVVVSAINVALVGIAAGCFAISSELEGSARTPWRERLVGTSSRRSIWMARTFFVEVLRALLGSGAVLLVGGALGIDFFVMLPLAAVGAFGVAILRSRRPLGIALIALVVVIGLAVSCNSADRYARKLRREVRRSASPSPALPPLPLRAVLQPAVGVAARGSERACVVRVSKDVIMGRGAVVVISPDRFAVRDCSVAETPFA
jgi:hypothetical protein